MTDRTPAAEAAYQMGRDLYRLNAHLDGWVEDFPGYTAAIVEAEDWPTLATNAAIINTLKARLALLEGDLATALGKGKGRHVGTLADGSRYTVEKSADRKAWDHDDWKRDVRRAITTKMLERVHMPTTARPWDPDTGAESTITVAQLIQAALAEAQAVHGSAAPKSTALRALDLNASDYADSTPGAWRVAFVKPDLVTPAVTPAAKPTTTTPKDA